MCLRNSCTVQSTIEALYCLRVRSNALPGLRYVFKAADSEARLTDADLRIPYDLDYETDSDAVGLAARLFSWREAVAACGRLRRVLGKHLEWRSESDVQVDLVAVDPRNPLKKFDAETRLLRLLPYWSQEGERLEGFSFAWASSRADGIRVDSKRLLYRRSPRPAQMCFEVTARRTIPGEEGSIIVRYGTWHRNTEGPPARLERFGFVEWEYPFYDWESERVLVEVSRALTEGQASAIAEWLRGSPDFCEVSVSANPLCAFAADEGMMPMGNVVFAQASCEQEQRLGFPHFLSVWPDEV